MGGGIVRGGGMGGRIVIGGIRTVLTGGGGLRGWNVVIRGEGTGGHGPVVGRVVIGGVGTMVTGGGGLVGGRVVREGGLVVQVSLGDVGSACSAGVSQSVPIRHHSSLVLQCKQHIQTLQHGAYRDHMISMDGHMSDHMIFTGGH